MLLPCGTFSYYIRIATVCSVGEDTYTFIHPHSQRIYRDSHSIYRDSHSDSCPSNNNNRHTISHTASAASCTRCHSCQRDYKIANTLFILLLFQHSFHFFIFKINNFKIMIFLRSFFGNHPTYQKSVG